MNMNIRPVRATLLMIIISGVLLIGLSVLSNNEYEYEEGALSWNRKGEEKLWIYEKGEWIDVGKDSELEFGTDGSGIISEAEFEAIDPNALGDAVGNLITAMETAQDILDLNNTLQWNDNVCWETQTDITNYNTTSCDEIGFSDDEGDCGTLNINKNGIVIFKGDVARSLLCLYKSVIYGNDPNGILINPPEANGIEVIQFDLVELHQKHTERN